jgi:hypothetical protein
MRIYTIAEWETAIDDLRARMFFDTGNAARSAGNAARSAGNAYTATGALIAGWGS